MNSERGMMILKSYAEIAAHLEKVWKIRPTRQAVHKWANAEVDPLPTHRVKVVHGGKRGMVSADSKKVEEWAKRRVRVR